MMNSTNPMNIAYSLNRYYLPYTLVSMYTLLTAGKGDRNLRILLSVDQDLNRDDLSPLFRMVSSFPGCTLEAIWPLSRTARRFVSDETCALSPDAVQVAYFRLFLPELFGGESRCLYLDSDLVITRPLTDLYDTDMGGKCIAGVTDRLCLEEPQLRRLKDDWGIGAGYYINAGVVLMNLEAMRASGGDREALELAYHKPFRYLDQDVLNQVFRGKVRLLPKAYNVFPDDRKADLAFLRRLLPEQEDLFPDQALTDPAIIQFIGRNKPWVSRGVPYEAFWHNAVKAYEKRFSSGAQEAE